MALLYPHTSFLAVIFFAFGSPFLFSCTAGPGHSDASAGSGGTSESSADVQDRQEGQEGPEIVIEGKIGTGGTEPTSPAVILVKTLPDTFAAADADHPETSKGGFQVVGPLADVPVPEGECANILRVIVRDFQATHDDFENAADWSKYEVLSPIGDSRKPQKTGTNGPLHFDEWYQNLEGVNLPFAVDLWLEPIGNKFVYDSAAFFPIKDVGFMDAYLFTTELHTNFEYTGGEVFTFRGDDDVFVYINGYLAVNLSGVHEAQEGSVDLDEQASAFGIEVGQVYAFDLFQAERQPGGSNFRLETTLAFTGCGEILPTDVVR